MSKKPLGSSTPNYCPRVTHRRGVHSYHNEEEFSPVVVNRSGTASPPTRSPTAKRHTFHTNSNLEDTDDSDSEEEQIGPHQDFSACRKFYVGAVAYIPECNDGSLEKSQEQEKNQEPEENREQEQNVVMKNKGMIAVVVLVLALVTLALALDNQTQMKRLEDIRKEFPLQDQDFWLAVDSGLKEVIQFNKPSVFLFLYKEDGESTTERILTDITSYANCVLNNNCAGKPIVLSSEELKTNELLKKDSGYLLTAYRTDLMAGHVMVVKNLENLPSYAAKILHSFCDEISPAVRKSVFFFTVRVAEFPKNELKYVKSLLKEKWHDIQDDQFEPLFARISGMILSVKS